MSRSIRPVAATSTEPSTRAAIAVATHAHTAGASSILDVASVRAARWNRRSARSAAPSSTSSRRGSCPASSTRAATIVPVETDQVHRGLNDRLDRRAGCPNRPVPAP
jgi:hypothetical protein